MLKLTEPFGLAELRAMLQHAVKDMAPETQLGHSSPTLTLRYVHLSKGHLASAVAVTGLAEIAGRC